jgi:branched-chain amino acid transport system ATP-binding protein
VTDALSLQGVGKRFGDFEAVRGVDLKVPVQQCCALLGPNGAGKTTLLNLISGRLSLSSGSIRVNGRDVSRDAAGARAKLGVGRSFQKTNIFPQLTLTENVRLGLQARTPGANWNPWRNIDADTALNEQARAMLARVDIRRPADTLAEELSYGEQRQLELAITLATQPRIVLLDEPTAGMSPTETALILDLLVELLAGLTVVIVEHDLSVVDRVADRIVVLERGSVIADGTPAAVKADSRVQSAYLKGAVHA